MYAYVHTPVYHKSGRRCRHEKWQVGTPLLDRLSIYIYMNTRVWAQPRLVVYVSVVSCRLLLQQVVLGFRQREKHILTGSYICISISDNKLLVKAECCKQELVHTVHTYLHHTQVSHLDTIYTQYA